MHAARIVTGVPFTGIVGTMSEGVFPGARNLDLLTDTLVGLRRGYKAEAGALRAAARLSAGDRPAVLAIEANGRFFLQNLTTSAEGAPGVHFTLTNGMPMPGGAVPSLRGDVPVVAAIDGASIIKVAMR